MSQRCCNPHVMFDSSKWGPVSKVLPNGPQVDAGGLDIQRTPLHIDLAIDVLERGPHPHLAVPLPPLRLVELLLGHRPRPDRVEVPRKDHPAVVHLEPRRDDSFLVAAAAGEAHVVHGRPRALLVQQGGDQPPVDDERPARGGAADVHHREDFPRGGVVEDVLVAADAVGRAERARGEAGGARVGGDGGVGFVVAATPAATFGVLLLF